MTRRCVILLMAVLGSSGWACAARTDATTVTSDSSNTSSMQSTDAKRKTSERWIVELTSDGGFSGRGNGGVTIDGSKAIAHRAGADCPTDLTPAERSSLDAIFASIHPDEWLAEYRGAATPEHGHPDQFHYQLTLQGSDGRKQTTSWYGESVEEEKLPSDLLRLREAVLAIQHRAQTTCETK